MSKSNPPPLPQTLRKSETDDPAVVRFVSGADVRYIRTAPATLTLQKRAEGEEDDGTVEAALSSDTPLDRGFLTEILVHTPEAVNLIRAAEGVALLLGHDPDRQVGRVMDLQVVEGRLRGRLRFGNSQEARDVAADVRDGIRREISIGYTWDETERDEKEDVVRVTHWTLYEVSLVSIPADINVGVGRAAQAALQQPNQPPIATGKERKMDEDEKKKQEAEAKAARERAVTEAREAETSRIREITAIGKKFSREADAEKFITEGKSAQEFRNHVLDSMDKDKTKPASEKRAEDANVGLTDKEVRRYSFTRLFRYIANPEDRNVRDEAAFELECSAAAAKKRGAQPEGIMVPADVLGRGVFPMMPLNRMAAQQRQMVLRALSAGTATDGAELVADDLLAGSFIDVLRNRMVTARLGAFMLTDLVGDVQIPRKTSGATAAWIATEGGDAAQSEPQFDQVALTPKTLGVWGEYTRKLLLQASLDVEALLRADLAAGMALAIDKAALYGSAASGQPRGVANQTGINTKTFTGANPTYAEVVELETLVAADNADIGTLAYATSATKRGAFKTTEKATGTAQFVWEPGNTVNGHRCEISNQITGNDVFFGNWADLLIGMWGGLDVLRDPYTKALAGTVRIITHQSVDIAVRHPESFCLGTNP